MVESLGTTTRLSETHQNGPVLISLSAVCQSQEEPKNLVQDIPIAARLARWGQIVTRNMSSKEVGQLRPKEQSTACQAIFTENIAFRILPFPPSPYGC